METKLTGMKISKEQRQKEVEEGIKGGLTFLIGGPVEGTGGTKRLHFVSLFEGDEWKDGPEHRVKIH